MTNIYDKTIRKWIHRFNNSGVKGLFTEIDYYSRMVKVSDTARNEIVRIASTNPRERGLKFSTWSLRSLAGYVIEEKKIIKEEGGNSISHTAIRDILMERGVESGGILGLSSERTRTLNTI